MFDRAGPRDQRRRNRAIVESVRDEVGDFALALGERSKECGWLTKAVLRMQTLGNGELRAL